MDEKLCPITVVEIILQLFNFMPLQNECMPVALAWSVEYLPSNPAARFRFPAGSENFYPWTGCMSLVCVMFSVVYDRLIDIVYLMTVMYWSEFEHRPIQNVGIHFFLSVTYKSNSNKKSLSSGFQINYTPTHLVNFTVNIKRR